MRGIGGEAADLWENPVPPPCNGMGYGMTVTTFFESVGMVHRPNHHLKVFIRPCRLLRFQNYSEKNISILSPVPHPLLKRPRVLVGGGSAIPGKS